MKENYYALLLCILRPDYSVERSLQAMMDGVFTKRRNMTIKANDIKDMIQMHQQGLTYEKIGEAYGITSQAVYRRIKRYIRRCQLAAGNT